MMQELTIDAALLGWYCKVLSFNKHRNFPFKIPNALSTQFLVLICSRLKLSSYGSVGFTKGVMSQGSRGYPESPNSQYCPRDPIVLINRLTCEVRQIPLSWLDPGNAAFAARKTKFESQT